MSDNVKHTEIHVSRGTSELLPGVAALRPQKNCSKCATPMQFNGLRWKCLPCHSAYNREWRKKHPLTPAQKVKDSARSIASVNKRRGKIVPQPCERCGAPNAQMHHEDYSKPLDVRWLCSPCHMTEHYPDAALKKAEPRRPYHRSDGVYCGKCLKNPPASVSQRYCKECRAAYQRKYRKKLKEELKRLRALAKQQKLEGQTNGKAEQGAG